MRLLLHFPFVRVEMLLSLGWTARIRALLLSPSAEEAVAGVVNCHCFLSMPAKLFSLLNCAKSTEGAAKGAGMFAFELQLILEACLLLG